MRLFKILASTLSIWLGFQAQAQVSLPSVFGDNMVLQRNSSVHFWGWASPNEEVKLTASWSPNDTLKTKANRQASWDFEVKTPAGPGPFSITITGYNTIELKNVLVGEVWLASGQSNMEWSASAGIEGGEEAIANATHPTIRFFNVPRRSAKYPQQNVIAQWQESTPESMKYFSAVAYFFGKKLQEDLDVPIGLISASWGGSPAEIWVPQKEFDNDSTLQESVKMLKKEAWSPSEPARAFNGMIHPVVPFKLAGVLWYQGETNTSNPDYYAHTFTTLIKSWRSLWGEEFPFYFAQIAPYNYGEGDAGVRIRNIQREVRSVNNTGMVMTADIGNIDDIHPRNKKDVGLRFANLALANHYNKTQMLVEGPLVKEAVKISKGVSIYFENNEGLFFKNSTRSDLFEVAGEDGTFKKAKAKIEDGKVILKSMVNDPKYVRYAWGNTVLPDLYNAVKLPASSFKIKVE